MKALFKILTLLIIFLIPTSCNKDDEPVNYTLYHTWEVKEFITLFSNNYQKDEDNKILVTFGEDWVYELKLDINTCKGEYESNVANLINIEIPACTEACCDSEFSTRFAGLMPSVTSYSIKGTTLDLNVPNWGTIRCELVE